MAASLARQRRPPKKPATRSRRRPAAAATPHPEVSAKEAGLRYVSDDHPGITRKRAGKGFRYVGPDGKPVKDEATLARIKRLAIPPAWTDVWISPLENGHLQATGRDARGRKQYRYHEKWRETRDETKYDRMLAFGKALPRIRRRVAADLKRTGMPREKVLATVVRLMDLTCIRVGNDEYAKENGSFGLTTFRNRHVEVSGSTVSFEFRGKSGKKHAIDVEDPHLARIVRKCVGLPGQELFQYVDEEGEVVDIGSDDVNEYLQEAAGDAFTAKDFRTWSGTVEAALALLETGDSATKQEAKRNLASAIEGVAERLGNTPAVCRKSYVHPAVVEAYLDGSFTHHVTVAPGASTRRSATGLSAGEKAVLALLKAQSRASKRGK